MSRRRRGVLKDTLALVEGPFGVPIQHAYGHGTAALEARDEAVRLLASQGLVAH